jgi:DNA repair exonuclease SbcCD ATPase subunit
MNTELTVIQRAAVALGSSKATVELTELAAASKSITAVTNAAGRTECHTACMKARAARIAVEGIAKDAREDAKNFSVAVIAEEKRLVAIIEPEEKRLKTLRDDFDAKIEADKEAKKQAEAKRIAAITARITAIKETVVAAAMKDPAGIKELIDNLESIVVDGTFGEFTGLATVAKTDTLNKLRELLTSKAAQAAEQLRLAEERAVEERRLADERAKLEAERKEADRIQAQRDAIARAEREQAEARAKEAREKEAADLKAQREELERREAEVKKVAEKQAAEAKARADAEEAARVAAMTKTAGLIRKINEALSALDDDDLAKVLGVVQAMRGPA